MAKKLLAIFNLVVGPYCAYWGWKQGGIYIPTVLFAGTVMSVFGLVLLFQPIKKKRPPEYRDVYVDTDEEESLLDDK